MSYPPEITAQSLILELERSRDAVCHDCHAWLCPHQMLMNVALGFKNAPRCLDCLGTALERDPGELLDSLLSYIHQRECFDTAWAWVASGDADSAHCKFRHADQAAVPGAKPKQVSGVLETEFESHSQWDAGDTGCGELLLELRLRLEGMKPGEIINLRACDPGAPEDLPAWCRLTGHRLRAAQHPHYWIERKD